MVALVSVEGAGKGLFPHAHKVRRGSLLTYVNGVPGIGKQTHCLPKLCAVEFLVIVTGGIVIRRIRIYNRPRRYRYLLIITAEYIGAAEPPNLS